MRLVVQADGSIATVSITGETLIWSMLGYSRAKMADDDIIFKDINDYFSRLSQTRQKDIWNIYAEIHNTFRLITNIKTLTDKLMVSIEKLYVAIQLPEIHFWLKKHGGHIQYPASVQRTVHDEDDMNPNRTYLRSDYTGLIVLAIALRPMVPIWGVYMDLVQRGADGVSALLREYVSLKLLYRSVLSDCEPVERLSRYLESSFGSDTDISPVILTTFSSKDLITWLLALVMVRRLSIISINNEDPKTSGLISNIHTFVEYAIKGFAKRFGDFRDKHSKVNNDEGTQNSSRLDAYRVRQNISIGDTAIFTVFSENVDRVHNHIDKTIPKETVDACVNMLMQHSNTPIKDEHITLVQWIAASAVPPRSIPLLHRQSLLNIMAVCQAALIHWGFPEIAHLMTALGKSQDENVATFTDDFAGGRGVMNNSLAPLIKELDEYYPYSTYDPGTKRRVNPAYESVKRLVNGYSQYEWYTQAPEILINLHPNLIGGNKRIRLGVDLTASLIRLIILLNQRAEQNDPTLESPDYPELTEQHHSDRHLR